MANCIIHPIPLFEINIESSLFTHRLNFGKVITSVAYVWYIEGTREKILVDAGGDVDYLTNVRGYSCKDIQSLDSGLAKWDLSVSDIDLVILTQLHSDHSAQAVRYPRARFLVQKDELEFTRNPHPVMAAAFDKQFIEGINLEVIDGDVQVCEEIFVFKTPGHTPGGQSVSVKTAKGVAVISGLCTIRENFEPPPGFPLPVVPAGMLTNVFDAYDSLLRIKEMADIVIPLHEPGFRNVDSIP